MKLPTLNSFKPSRSDPNLLDPPMAQEKSYDMNVRIASRVLQVVLAALTAAMVQRVDPAAFREANVVSTAIAVIWVTYLSVPTAGVLLAYHYLPAVRKKWPLSRVLGVEMGMSLLGTLVHVGMTVGLALATGAVRSPAAGTAMVFATVFATGSAVAWGYSAYRATRDLFWRGRDKGEFISISSLSRFNDQLGRGRGRL
ncbi:hypothetical protein AMAG_01036 [Allomyces macrogynus ATCC 38327]|uniref:Uncharacterized protein n=1 Tax=Allomyces macrogynus (strain ATCC 38327) TaxID=578462 RepID=A0A0L0RXP2_ALLM3|nr:hypothetical protein AMAG_01036 [Allomyces macrogynus ATCC 38327]|eukprot:KNE55103.1 hypothetical protein AMAG_01036 [Allomyces macrogynus ATCC 38327]